MSRPFFIVRASATPYNCYRIKRRPISLSLHRQQGYLRFKSGRRGKSIAKISLKLLSHSNLIVKFQISKIVEMPTSLNVIYKYILLINHRLFTCLIYFRYTDRYIRIGAGKYSIGYSIGWLLWNFQCFEKSNRPLKINRVPLLNSAQWNNYRATESSVHVVTNHRGLTFQRLI